ncbi:CapA family protein [Priestia aryabhattai]|uniref:CapA family protein n=1 Tax=Priestia megaterium TaxID=1404 RepID=UPI0039B88F3E
MNKYLKKAVIYGSLCFLLGACGGAGEQTSSEPQKKEETVKSKEEVSKKEKKEATNTTIKISAAGDFTLGNDESFSYDSTFNDVAARNGLPYFTQNVKSIFEQDDLTTVNLETTLTTATEKASKTFRFKGDPSFVNILKQGSIETVNLANNHTHDYLQQGYDDTRENLKKSGIGYFGYEDTYITTVKGVKVGLLGYPGWDDTEEIRSQIKDGIKSLKEKGAKVIIVHFHWGSERHYVPDTAQQALAKYTIDNGADLILGHHPHVVQGIEEYKNKFIVYSLGNFMFGGNKNPSDKDTFVFQQTFTIKDGKLTTNKDINVIPFRISSTTARNDYRPTPLTGAEKDRVKNKLIDVSNQIKQEKWTVYDEDSK